MLHILTLFLLPFFVSSAEAKGAFLYFCFGEDCSEWDGLFSLLSITFTLCCLLSACASYCKDKEKDEQELQIVKIETV